MLTTLKINLTYDGTTQGNIDKAAFKSAIDSELSNNLIYPDVVSGYTTLHSFAAVSGNTVTAELFYDSSNLGIASKDSFWTTCMTEKSKSTVTRGSLSDRDFHPELFSYDLIQFEKKGTI